MSFDPTKTYRAVLDIDGNIFAFQGGRYYDRYGNSFATLPVNKEGYAPPTDVEITPEFLGDTLVINADATGTGNDWKYTIARPTSTMTSAQTLTLPATGGTAARTQDKLSVFAATTSAELAGVISDETGSGKLVFDTGPVFQGALNCNINSTAGPGWGFGPSGTPTYGLGYFGANLLLFAGSVIARAITPTTKIDRLPSDWIFGWSSTINNLAAEDTGITRLSGGKIAFGNGTAGDYSGYVIAGFVGVGTTTPAEKLTVLGNIQYGPATANTSGGYARKFIESTATLTGASTVITLNIPIGARLLGAQLRVDTAVTSGDGGTTWAAAYSGGSTTSLCTGQAFTKNTKVNSMHVDEITSNTTNVTITPNSGTFSAGVIRAIVYYDYFATLADNP